MYLFRCRFASASLAPITSRLLIRPLKPTSPLVVREFASLPIISRLTLSTVAHQSETVLFHKFSPPLSVHPLPIRSTFESARHLQLASPSCRFSSLPSNYRGPFSPSFSAHPSTRSIHSSSNQESHPDTMDRAKLIIIEGNISAGKSTLAKELAQKMNMRVFLEPVVANPYLEDFYKNPKMYALRMQIWLLKQRYLTYLSALRYMLETGTSVILDRSVFSDSVFAVKNKWDENISSDGFDFYVCLRERLLTNLPIPQITLYLDVAPEVCYDRVHSLRKRDCESGIPLEYLQGLDICYRQFLDEMREKGSAMVIIPWNEFGSVERTIQQVQSYFPSASTAEKKSVHSPNWGIQDVKWMKQFLYDERAILQRMNIASLVTEAGVRPVEEAFDDRVAPVDPDMELRVELNMKQQQQSQTLQQPPQLQVSVQSVKTVKSIAHDGVDVDSIPRKVISRSCSSIALADDDSDDNAELMMGASGCAMDNVADRPNAPISPMKGH